MKYLLDEHTRLAKFAVHIIQIGSHFRGGSETRIELQPLIMEAILQLAHKACIWLIIRNVRFITLHIGFEPNV
jgi:EAL domain-containing protein (putative c-di-GMP-specific phosphodiesterase class I)